jgi:hypothetical protein
MHEAPQHAGPARSTHPIAPAAQPALDVLSVGAGATRAVGNSTPALYIALPDGSQLYVCDLPLRAHIGRDLPLTLTPSASAEVIRWNIGAALTIYQRDLNRLHCDDYAAPTTTDGESHLTDESVLAEFAESQERARTQLYGARVSS